MKASTRGAARAPLRASGGAVPHDEVALLMRVALGLSASAAATAPAPSAQLSGWMPLFEPGIFGSVRHIVGHGNLFKPQPLALPGGARTLKGAVFVPVPWVFGVTVHLTAAGPFAPVGPQPQTPIVPAPH